MIVEFKGKKTSRIPEWCQENPKGYCLELITSTFARLHPASFGKEGEHWQIISYTGCSTNLDELIKWGESKKRKIVACWICFPNGFVSSETSIPAEREPWAAGGGKSSWPFPNPGILGTDSPAEASSTDSSPSEPDDNALPVVAIEIAGREESQNVPLPIPMGNRTPQAATSEVTRRPRDALVKAWVLQQANGKCEGCEKPSSFNGVDGLPYLEVHHVRHMADNGSDTPTNAVALCPNCHQELHHGVNAQSMVARLYERVARLVRE